MDQQDIPMDVVPIAPREFAFGTPAGVVDWQNMEHGRALNGDEIREHPVLAVNFRLDSATRTKIERNYGCTFHTIPYGPTPPAHDSLCAIAFLEGAAFAHARRTILRDVMPLSVSNRLVHHVHDPIRDHPLPFNGFIPSSYSVTTPCQCDADPLSCDMPHDFVYFGTSIGAYTTSAVAALLVTTRKETGYAIFPRIDNLAGKGVDYTYYTPAPGQLTITMHGNTFTVLDPHFLRDGFTSIPFTDIHVEPLETIGDWTLYHISLGYHPGDEEFTPPIRHIAPLWRDDIADRWDALLPSDKYAEYSTLAAGKPTTTQLAWASIGVSRIKLASTFAVFVVNDEARFVFSRSIAFKGLRTFNGRPRTPELKQSIDRWVNSEYSQLTMLPEKLKYEAVVATAIFILVSVGFESDVLQRHLQAAHVRFGTHASLVAFRAPMSITKEKIVGGVAYTGLTAYAGHVATDSAHNNFSNFIHQHSTSSVAHLTTHTVAFSHAFSMKAALVSTAFVSAPVAVSIWAVATATIAAYSYIYPMYVQPKPITAWQTQSSDESSPPLPRGVYVLPKGVTFTATKRMKTSTPAQDAGSQVTPPLIAPVKPPTSKIQALGACFQEVPTYFENDATTQLTALMHRVSIATPAPVPGLWDIVAGQFLTIPANVAVDRELAEPDRLYRHTRNTLARYASKFPKSHQMELLKAYDAYMAAGRVLTPSDLSANMFVKGELSNKPAIDETGLPELLLQESTPRGIISFKPIVNATFGPIVQHFYSTEKSVRSAAVLSDETDPSMLAFAPVGCSGEVLGAWATKVVNHLGGPDCVVTLCSDSAKFDAHNTKESRIAGRRLTIGRVKGADAIKIVVQHKLMDTLRGRSAAGVAFRVDKGIVSSGEPITSAGNTKETEAKATYVIKAPGDYLAFNPGRNIFIAAQGDDLYVIARKAWFDTVFADCDPASELAERCLRLGFEDEFHVYNGVDGDFCSRWWYPVGNTYLPGGKIGRTLAKAGYFLSSPQEMTVRSAALGALQDNYHVPFLREYFEKVTEVAAKCARKLGGKPNEYAIHMASKHEYDDSTLEFVERKYGLTKQDLAEFKALLEQVTTLPVVISWPLLHKCMAIDAA